MDAIEKGCKPRLVPSQIKELPTGPTDPAVAVLDSSVDPTVELMKECVGRDKPDRISSDSLPCNQESVRQSTMHDETTFQDHQELWTRVMPSAFLKTLNRHKIRVRVDHAIPNKKNIKKHMWQNCQRFHGKSASIICDDELQQG